MRDNSALGVATMGCNYCLYSRRHCINNILDFFINDTSSSVFYNNMHSRYSGWLFLHLVQKLFHSSPHIFNWIEIGWWCRSWKRRTWKVVFNACCLRMPNSVGLCFIFHNGYQVTIKDFLTSVNWNNMRNENMVCVIDSIDLSPMLISKKKHLLSSYHEYHFPHHQET